MTKKTESSNITRGNIFSIPPEELIINQELQGRAFPITQKQIEERAHSILKHGQLEPIGVRKVKNQHHVIYGFTRALAIKWGNETGLFNPPLKVQAVVKTVNDEQSFVLNQIENLERNDTTPLDHAFNQNKLREQYGWSEKEIAELYKCSQVYVGQLKKLLLLDKKTQMKIHEGKLSVNAAIMLADADVPSSEMPELLKACSDDEGRVNTGTLKATLRNFVNGDEGDSEAQETGDDTDGQSESSSPVDDPVDSSSSDGIDILTPQPKKKTPKKKPDDKPAPKYPRSLKEIKAFWNDQTGIIDPPAVGEFAKSMLKFLEGSISEKQMTNAFDKLTQALQNGEE